MTEQYVVAAFLDGTLVVDAAGPFRSAAKAQEVCDRFNDASEWTEELESATLVAQVVRLMSVSDLMNAARQPEGDPSNRPEAGEQP